MTDYDLISQSSPSAIAIPQTPQGIPTFYYEEGKQSASASEGDTALKNELATDERTTSEILDDFARQIESLENALKTQEETSKKLAEADSKLVDADKTFATRATTGATLRIGGRIHQDFWGFPKADAGAAAFEGEDPDNRWIFRRIRLELEGNVTDNMIYRFQIEFATPNFPEIRDVYIGFAELPVFQTVLIGNHKRPYGLDHLNSSRSNIFMERPAIIEAFNQDARRLGVSSLSVSDNQAWNLRYGLWNLQNIQGLTGYEGDSGQLEFAGRLANMWWYDETSDGRGYGQFAISGSLADPNGRLTDSAPANEAVFRSRSEARSNVRWLDTGRIAGADTYELLGLESAFNVGRFHLCGELQGVSLQRDNGNDLGFWGGYAQAAYFLTGEHMPWDRKNGFLGTPNPFENFFLVDRCRGGTGTGWGAWQIAARYSHADLSSDNVLGGEGSQVTLGLNWLWNANCRLQINGSPYGKITNHAPVNGLTTANYEIFGARFNIFF